MKSKIQLCIAVAIYSLSLSVPGLAQAPGTINQQGRLTSPSGIPLFNVPGNTNDGQIDLVFQIYDALTGGSEVWSQTASDVAVYNGLFSVLLTNLNASVFPATEQVARWLEMTVITDGTTNTLSPRKEIVSVAYAMRAGDAATLSGLSASQLGITNWAQLINFGMPAGFMDGVDDVGILNEVDPQVGVIVQNYIPRWDGSNLVTGSIYNDPANGNIGIGTPSPAAKLDVEGGASIRGPLSVGEPNIQVMGTNILMVWPHQNTVANLNADLLDGKHAEDIVEAVLSRFLQASAPTGLVATGGTITTNGGYRIHTFTNVGTANFIVSGGPLVCDVLVVAGGGGGINPGGGAGGVIITNGLVVSGTITVNIGNGGRGGGITNGGNSVFGSLTAIGGGHGQDYYGYYSLKEVGSGGSGGGGADVERGGAVGSGTPGQGYAGGIGFSDTRTYTSFGGGGGAGEPGHAGTSSFAGNGGDGLACDFSGTSVYYGGGGGGLGDGRPRGMGGKGGGGNGSDSASHYGSHGQANTGGGGGGNGAYFQYYDGGSGIVIVRYPISDSGPAMTFSFPGINQANASATNVFMGKVGIGTNNPAEQLHVLGNVRVDGTTIVAAINLGGQPRTNWPTVIPGTLVASSNLSDIGDPVAARANLGLGSAATSDSSAFDPAGAAAAVDSALTNHTGNLSNPHQVTATQVGALTPTGDGSQLTGITALQVGALTPTGNGSQLTGITAAQVGALASTGDGSQLTGITAAQVGALSTNGGVVNGALDIKYIPPKGDLVMGSFTNQPGL